MKIISPASETVLGILKNFKKAETPSRLLKYSVHTVVDDGILLLNLLTRELVLLTQDEFDHITEIDHLKKNWFIVPENTNEKECTDFVKFFLNTRVKKSPEITGYTIFTTTDCNARCFYCFELGRSRIPMSNEVALKTVEFIKSHCGGKPVRFGWFGGEPLMNPDVIDTICEGVRAEGIEYASKMVSNGYLFSDDIINKAVNLWNLKKVQITLDGTEDIYNKVKAFVYKEGNPYQIVLNNVERLLKSSVNVTIRLNMDLHNAEDLLTLAQELSHRFGGTKGLNVYAHHLFKAGVAEADQHTEEEWAKRGEAMRRIEQVLHENGLSSKAGISKKFRTNHCMADSGSAVTILPDGNIGLCEHHTEDEFVGHLDREGFDQVRVASWKETTPEIPECADCFYFPECIKLKKCTNSGTCYPQYRINTLRSTQQKMINEYEKWKSGATQDEPDDLLDE